MCSSDIRWVERQLHGSCLCGQVDFQLHGPVRDVINCFCSQCRKTSGHHVAATAVDKSDLTFTRKHTLRWYECLPGVWRGFCQACGSSLFWDAGKENRISVMAGCLEPPTGLRTAANIHVEDASDYCVIPRV